MADGRWASGSSAAASSRGFTSAHGRRFATPTFAGSGARIARARKRPPRWRASLRVGEARALRLDRGDGRRSVHRLHLDLRSQLRPPREHGAHRRTRGRSGAELVGIACEKPLARNVAEARRWWRSSSGAACCTAISRTSCSRRASSAARRSSGRAARRWPGRPYLARAAEEHGGPHMPWFWRGDLQGGGVLNDMMCHSLEVGRYLLTAPGAPRDSIRPTKVSAQIASLKWSRPEYVAAAQGDDERRTSTTRASPAEDFARASVNYVDEQRHIRSSSRRPRRGAMLAPACA